MTETPIEEQRTLSAADRHRREDAANMRTLFYKNIVLFLLVPFLLSAGCRAEKDLPFYRFDSLAEMPVLTVDGIRYIVDTDVVQPSLYQTGPWSFTGELGGAVGVCGGESAERGGGYDIRRVKGDEACDFLFIRPNHFVFGPYYTYICVREDLRLTPPSPETASRADMVMTVDDNELELTDLELITALLDFYFEGTGDEVFHAPDEDRTTFTLVFHHRDFPFLTAGISGCQNTGTGAVYLTCSDEIHRELPAGLAARLSMEM